MGRVIVNETYLSDIADAIRSKNGTENTYTPAEMADAIEAISGGGITPTGTKQISITQNGTTTEDVTNYASAEISVNVPTGSTPVINSLSVTENGTYTAPSGVDGYSPIIVNVPSSGGDPVYLTKVLTSSGDVTIKQALDAAQYQMHYTDAIVLIRANGSTAPTTGSYTLNNFWYAFENSIFKSGFHCYKSGKAAPDSMGLYTSGEYDANGFIENGVLCSKSISANCMGGTGTDIMILEIPIDYSVLMGL